MKKFRQNIFHYLARGLPVLVGGYIGLNILSRKTTERTARHLSKILMTDLYDENLWELVSATKRDSPQTVLETSLRAQEGKAIERPLGSPKKFPSLDELMFSFAQIQTMPVPGDREIILSTVIGKKAKKPLVLSMPILISGMAYGFALSERFRIALAQGAAMAGTAANIGEGPLLPKERQVADNLIMQYNRGSWNKSVEILEQADMLELQFGQGALGGTSHYLEPKQMSPILRKRFGMKPGERVVAHARIPGINEGPDLIRVVRDLRKIVEDIPIGVKIGAGDQLEKDLEWALRAGVDIIAIDGAEAATKASSPILQDDFGIPTVYALSRAVNYLEKVGAREEIELLVSGGLRTPGHFLKALALGADAVYIGSTALFAASHTQVLKALPFEPPTQIAWENGKYRNAFNVKKGAQSLSNFLKACAQEMKIGLQALGKTSPKELSKNDLVALNETMAKALGIKPAYLP